MCATPLPKKKEKRKKTIFIMLLIQYTASPASKHTHTHHTTDPHTSPLPDLSLRPSDLKPVNWDGCTAQTWFRSQRFLPGSPNDKTKTKKQTFRRSILSFESPKEKTCLLSLHLGERGAVFDEKNTPHTPHHKHTRHSPP